MSQPRHSSKNENSSSDDDRKPSSNKKGQSSTSQNVPASNTTKIMPKVDGKKVVPSSSSVKMKVMPKVDGMKITKPASPSSGKPRIKPKVDIANNTKPKTVPLIPQTTKAMPKVDKNKAPKKNATTSTAPKLKVKAVAMKTIPVRENSIKKTEPLPTIDENTSLSMSSKPALKKHAIDTDKKQQRESTSKETKSEKPKKRKSSISKRPKAAKEDTKTSEPPPNCIYKQPDNIKMATNQHRFESMSPSEQKDQDILVHATIEILEVCLQHLVYLRIPGWGYRCASGNHAVSDADLITGFNPSWERESVLWGGYDSEEAQTKSREDLIKAIGSAAWLKAYHVREENKKRDDWWDEHQTEAGKRKLRDVESIVKQNGRFRVPIRREPNKNPTSLSDLSGGGLGGSGTGGSGLGSGTGNRSGLGGNNGGSLGGGSCGSEVEKFWR